MLKKCLLLSAVLLLTGLQLFGTGDDSVRVTIIYDNYAASDLETDWGFACLVEYRGSRILFDAGRSEKLYQKNLEALNIEPAGIPSLIISHSHGDHTAGMQWLSEENPDMKIYLPASFASSLEAKGELPSNSRAVRKAKHLYGPFYSTGEDFIAFHEQGLVIKTARGGVLITGCGHPGVLEMVRAAEKAASCEIIAVIGGLHLMSSSSSKLDEIATELKKSGVLQICPTHCTGKGSIEGLKEAFGPGYIPGGTGRVISIL